MNLRAEHNRAMENDLQMSEIPLANQRPVLTAPSLKLAENCGFLLAIWANLASALRSGGQIFA